MSITQERKILTPVAERLIKTDELGEKQEILLAHPRVQKAHSEGLLDPFLPHSYDLSAKIALFALVVSGQERVLVALEPPTREQVRKLLTLLMAVDRFYVSIGGIVGYQLKVLELLESKGCEKCAAYFSHPPHEDLSDEAVEAGIEALPELGEIYPLAGLGSRLGLISKSGTPLPVAELPFLGRPLLEGLIRDLQAREYLYYLRHGKQVTVPIAMMTLHDRVKALCEYHNWFGRPRESFKLFKQLSVPVVSEQGEWVLEAPFEPLVHPGGHGALWRTADEEGVFQWFLEQGRHRLLIRQINNPIAGIDRGLLALIGVGKLKEKAFGFAACERRPGAAEGVLVLKEEKEGVAHLSNIEYTELKEHGLEESGFPANTNILYADLSRLQEVIKKSPLPGLMLNMKHKVEKGGVCAGRLESMMQNISDTIPASSTFLTLNARKKTISATKKAFAGELMETPEGALYDLFENTHELLKSCGVTLDAFGSKARYLEEGPSHLFLYHPALGPLYEVIREKIRGGQIAEGSELQLEIADVELEAFELDGSLLIEAHNVMGHTSDGIVRYSGRRGRCVLRGVRVANRGIDRGAANTYWKGVIQRHEACKIILEGHSELIAEDVVLEGDQTITVPDGERWTIKSGGIIEKVRLDLGSSARRPA